MYDTVVQWNSFPCCGSSSQMVAKRRSLVPKLPGTFCKIDFSDFVEMLRCTKLGPKLGSLRMFTKLHNSAAIFKVSKPN